MDLIQKKCVPCEGGVPTLTKEEIEKYMIELKVVFPSSGSQSQSDSGSWEVQGNAKIKKLFKFKDFKEAMVFVNKIADLAENENHHSDIAIHYNKVDITTWTHAIGGLSENDFILAAKIDKIT